MKKLKQHYMGSVYFTLVALVLGFTYGLLSLGTVSLAFSTLILIIVLGILEVSLSFDNAIVNSRVLSTMSKVWQQRFVTYGMAIAVFGTRILFPVLIVSIAGGIGMLEAVHLALTDQKHYAEVLSSAHTVIAGFGGAFLMLVALGFFLDEEKDTHWFKGLETRLQKLGSALSTSIVLLALLIMYNWVLPEEVKVSFLLSGLLGIIMHEIIARLGDSMGSQDDLTVAVAKSGIASFIYLEILDSTYSLDGLIGALAISTNIVIIAMGLSIGAMFVRSMTLHMVEAGTLSEYKYLEHGAFYSILVLSIIMFVSTVYEVPELVTGLTSVFLIGGALYYSIKTR